MRMLFFTLPFIFAACGQSSETETTTSDSTKTTADTSVTETDDISGTYEYVNPYNSLDLIHNHYIVLEKNSDNTYSGRYYGVTDMFDPERTEYAAGFFVLPMKDLIIEGENMSFELVPQQTDFFNETIDLSMKNSEEAKAAGLTSWEVYMLWESKKLNAKIAGGVISLLDQPEEMSFVPMN
ncbi:MAG: hypothetical protein JNJ99_10645 [Crocinitomicaceae bacterium]|nr:hypothetical protein [Crocinitomicaceae bacterium]